MATLATDNFNRSSRSLDGDTMSDSVNTWALGAAGGFSIPASNVYCKTDTSGDTVEYCDSESSVHVRVRAKTLAVVQWEGIMARYQADDPVSGYISRRNKTSGLLQLIRKDAGSTTTLGTGSSVSANDYLGCVASGSNISAELNGSTDVGPVTDSNYSTGYGAMYGNGSAGQVYFDNFAIEDAPAAVTKASIVITG